MKLFLNLLLMYNFLTLNYLFAPPELTIAQVKDLMKRQVEIEFLFQKDYQSALRPVLLNHLKKHLTLEVITEIHEGYLKSQCKDAMDLFNVHLFDILFIDEKTCSKDAQSLISIEKLKLIEEYFINSSILLFDFEKSSDFIFGAICGFKYLYIPKLNFRYLFPLTDVIFRVYVTKISHITITKEIFGEYLLQELSHIHQATFTNKLKLFLLPYLFCKHVQEDGSYITLDYHDSLIASLNIYPLNHYISSFILWLITNIRKEYLIKDKVLNGIKEKNEELSKILRSKVKLSEFKKGPKLIEFLKILFANQFWHYEIKEDYDIDEIKHIMYLLLKDIFKLTDDQLACYANVDSFIDTILDPIVINKIHDVMSCLIISMFDLFDEYKLDCKLTIEPGIETPILKLIVSKDSKLILASFVGLDELNKQYENEATAHEYYASYSRWLMIDRLY